MTLVLRKKHQITQSNTRRWTPVKWAGVAVSCALLIASGADWIRGEETDAPDSAAAKQRGRYAAPLERLRSRTPEQRWEQLRHPSAGVTPVNPSELAASEDFPSDEEAAIGVFQTLSRPNRRNRIGRDNFLPSDRASAAARAAEQNLTLPGSSEFGQESFPQRDAAPTPVDYQPVGSYREPTEDFSDESPALEMSQEFPQADATEDADFGYYMTDEQISGAANDPIYQEIEEKFPRIRVAVPEEPQFEQPIQRPANSNTNTTSMVAQLQNYGSAEREGSMGELISSPKDIKPLNAIKPYFDYEPDPEVLENDPYLNVFPRPDEAVETDEQKQFPEIVDLGEDLYQQRDLAHVDLYWEAADTWHYPLYFEDAAHERYGHTHHWLAQPFVSFGKFGVQFFGLPYQMSIHPIHEKQYTLGWYQPGEFVPYKYYQVPWNTDAAVRTAAFYTGMIYAFP